MIDVIVMYPRKDGSTFDMDYYCGTHIPLCRKLLGSALKGVVVQQGVSGAAPGSGAPFMAVGQLRFDSIETFLSAFAPAAAAIQGDIPNYTNVEPVILVSEVKIS